MAGENPEDVEHDDVAVVRRSDEFLSKTKWERFQVLIMGPVMNLALALVLTAVVLYQGVERGAYEDQPPVVGVVTRTRSAARAGHPAGRSHRCRWPGGRSTPGRSSSSRSSTRGEPRDRDCASCADGLEQTRTRHADRSSSRAGSSSATSACCRTSIRTFASVQPGGAAEKAGIKTGDVVLAVDGQPITFSYHLKDAIAKHPEQPITLTILRDGKQQTIQATPARNGHEGLLGIGIGDETVKFKPGLGRARSR